MAKKVLSFFDGSTSGHGNAKYPWDRWADGNIWEVTAGVDFDCKPVSFRGVLYSYAKRSGLKLQVQSLTRMGKLRFRFYNPAVEELTTEPVVEVPAAEEKAEEVFTESAVVHSSRCIDPINDTSQFGDGLN